MEASALKGRDNSVSAARDVPPFQGSGSLGGLPGAALLPRWPRALLSGPVGAKIAEAEGVPVYAIFTNEQLAAMVQRKATTAAGLAAIEGVGQARLEKHGPRLLAILAVLPTPSAQPTP